MLQLFSMIKSEDGIKRRGDFFQSVVDFSFEKDTIEHIFTGQYYGLQVQPCFKWSSCCSIFRILFSVLQIVVCPFARFLLVIVLSLFLRFTYYDYLFGFFNLFLLTYIYNIVELRIDYEFISCQPSALVIRGTLF